MTDKTLLLVGGIAVVGVAAYFVYQATAAPTDQTGSSCNGDWTDYVNPVCWLSGVTADASNTINQATNEVNTVLIIVALLVAVVVGILAFGPGGGDLLRTARSFV